MIKDKFPDVIKAPGEFILLLNPDTVVLPEALDRLVDYLR